MNTNLENYRESYKIISAEIERMERDIASPNFSGGFEELMELRTHREALDHTALKIKELETVASFLELLRR